MLFVASNLEHGVSGGVENRLAGFRIALRRAGQNDRTGRVAVTEIARRVGAFYQLIQRFLREAVFVVAEIAGSRTAPARRRVPSGRTAYLCRRRQFVRPCVCANQRPRCHPIPAAILPVEAASCAFNQPQTRVGLGGFNGPLRPYDCAQRRKLLR